MRLILARGCKRITTNAAHGMRPRRERQCCRIVRHLPRTGLTDILRGTPRW